MGGRAKVGMKAKISRWLLVVTITGTVLALGNAAPAATQPAIVIDPGQSEWSKDYAAFQQTAIYTRTDKVKVAPVYIGDQSTGETSVNEQTVPGTGVADQQLSQARCSDGTFKWCDWIPLTINAMPEGSRWNLDLVLTWPGKALIDPATKRELRLNNLDFYLYVRTFFVYKYENGEELEIVGAWTARAGERIRNSYPKSLNIADAPATDEIVPAAPPEKLGLGGPAVYDATWPDPPPSCPPDIRDNKDLQPTLCPKITEHHNYYRYGLIVISRNHVDDVRSACGTAPNDPPKACDEVFNKGYTISTKFELTEGFTGPRRPDRNAILFDRSTSSFTGGSFTDPASFEEEGLPIAKQPGADGPASNQELLALKGSYRGPTEKPLPVVPIALALALVASLVFWFFLRRSRKREEEATA